MMACKEDEQTDDNVGGKPMRDLWPFAALMIRSMHVPVLGYLI